MTKLRIWLIKRLARELQVVINITITPAGLIINPENRSFLHRCTFKYESLDKEILKNSILKDPWIKYGS